MDPNKKLTEIIMKKVESAIFHREDISDYFIMEQTKDNYAFREIKPCHCGLIIPLVKLIKRTTRKFLKWYIEPICNQQTEFNNAVYRRLILLEKRTEDKQCHRNSQETGQLKSIQEQIDEIKNQMLVSVENIHRLDIEKDECIEELKVLRKMIEKLEKN